MNSEHIEALIRATEGSLVDLKISEMSEID